MITKPEATEIETQNASPTERNFMTGYYDGRSQEINYASFIEDVHDISATNRERLLNYLSNDLTKIYKDSSDKEPTRISFVNTEDQNVELMQEKLYTLGATDTPLEDQNFYTERSYTISTFRTLFVIENLIRTMSKIESGNNIQLVDILLENINKQTTYGSEDSFREPVYNSRGILLCRFKDADMRRTSEYINPEGKVTKMEIATEILPRVKRILENMGKSNPAFIS